MNTGMTITLRSYVTGFVLSLVLTIGAYLLVTSHPALSSQDAFLAIAALACAQFAVQMKYFLHIGAWPASRDRLIAIGFAVVVVLIVVSGSLWIMDSLNARMMPSQVQMEQYMVNQTGI